MRQGAATLCAVAIIGGVGGGVALSGSDEPSIRAGVGATATVDAYTEPSVTVELPDGWVVSDGVRYDQEILAVGTAVQPAGLHHAVCQADASYDDDVFVILHEFTLVTLLTEKLAQPTSGASDVSYPPRPDDFTDAAGETSPCATSASGLAWEARSYRFQDGGRLFFAVAGLGPSSTAERRMEAYTVLNSLVVEPFETPLPPPVPVTTVPPVTVPPSADTEAIVAAFEGWVAARPPNFEGADPWVEDWAGIKETAQEAAELVGNPQCYTGRVDAITRIDEDDADVIFSFRCDGRPAAPSNQPGRAVKIDGVWMVSRDTVCATFAIGQARCPPS